jgi:hypothetical protein
VFEQLSPAKSSPSLSDHHHHHPAPWWKASMDNLRTGQEFFPPRYREDDIWNRRGYWFFKCLKKMSGNVCGVRCE